MQIVVSKCMKKSGMPVKKGDVFYDGSDGDCPLKQNKGRTVGEI